MAKSIIELSGSRQLSRQCTDTVVGDILAGWRYDISGLSPAMRKDYDHHLSECASCRRRQRLARTIDVLLLSVCSLSIFAFLMAAAVLHRVETITHLSNSLHGHVHNTTVTISLEAAAIAGLVVSVLLCLLVAMSTPIPGIVSSAVQQRLPENIRERLTRNAA
jgi:hypothetical protein